MSILLELGAYLSVAILLAQLDWYEFLLGVVGLLLFWYVTGKNAYRQGYESGKFKREYYE